MVRAAARRAAENLKSLRPLAGLLILVWAAFALDWALGGVLKASFGLEPRRLAGIDGVLLMPFLHADLQHLLGNTPPLIVLGALLKLLMPQRFWPATAIVVFGGGACLWLLGRDYVHIGASSLIFGWFGFLVAAGALERSVRALLGAATALALYGAAVAAGLTGAQATGDGALVSWEAHLFGLMAGVAAAAILRAPKRRRVGGRTRAITRPRP